jgi:Uma2 family endonuclease
MGEIGVLGEGDEMIDGIVVVRGNWNPWRWTLEDYRKMAEAGILKEQERTELVQGEIVELPMQSEFHAHVLNSIWRALMSREDALVPGHIVMARSPVVISNDTEVQPDVVVAFGSHSEFDARHPSPSDVRLLVEVSDERLRTDQTKKYLIYACAGIPEYWLVNLGAKQLEVYRQPTGTGYSVSLIYKPGDVVNPLIAPSVDIAVSDVLYTS